MTRLKDAIDLGSAVITTAAYAARQAAGGAGRLFLPNNGQAIERDTGAAWVPWGPIYPFVDPKLRTLAWTNQGTATEDTSGTGLLLTSPASGGYSLRIRREAAPATPYTLTCALQPQWDLGGVLVSCGMCFRQSSDGKLHLLWLTQAATTNQINIYSYKFTNESTPSAQYQSAIIPTNMPLFYRIADNGVNRILSFSYDGVNFIAWHSIGRTDFLTADQVGFFVDGNTAHPMAMRVLSYAIG